MSTVEDDEIVFRLAAPAAPSGREEDDQAVSLWTDLHLSTAPFAAVEGGWELRIPHPPVDRLEYLFDVEGDLLVDPGNPRVVTGAFGAHSWLPLPGYVEPAWLAGERAPGSLVPASLERTPVGPVDLQVWSPDSLAHGAPAPLLISHDGPEMAAYGGLVDYASAMVAAGTLPPFRVALLEPGARNERYAANPAYTKALTEDVVPHLRDHFPTEQPLVLMGQSLGALAALHAAWTTPGLFGGIFCQSGSFFTPVLDPQESEHRHFKEITGFVATVLAAESASPRAPVTGIVCGSAEENVENNRLLADHLRTIGVDVAWGEVRDGHTWTCWRDLLDPHLTGLLRRVWKIR